MIKISIGLATKSIHTKSGFPITEPWSSSMYFNTPTENRVRFSTDYFREVRVEGIQKFINDLTLDDTTVDLFISLEYDNNKKYISLNLSKRIRIVNWKEYKLTSEEFDLYEGFGKIALIKDVAVNDTILYTIDVLLNKNKRASNAVFFIVTSKYLIHFGASGDVINILSTDPMNIKNLKMNYKGIFDTFYDEPLS
ncbi:hypothetical protein CSE16_08220 [Solibacillus sp. R5-41]|uniref:hypothetical protein n=1 Tax=Solibacillus sp. R5-41 TaxID=2048654 RepID=UPI000C124E71|nr:hypothetical protein [Solibacillus sp. R5-41]ATP40033.1 hypothetical protein CSE16_08220 [Solibacillus sp. R5-41]